MPLRILRYPEVTQVQTARDPFNDLVGLLNFLSSADYVAELLVSKHSVALGASEARARRIVPHIKTGLALLDQTFSSPLDVAFLSAYYAVLNLIKVCILFGRYHSELSTNRWHGASYEVGKKDSQHLLTERIRLHQQGAIALFYKTLTGKEVRTAREVKLDDVYSLLNDVQLEYHTATGKENNIAMLSFELEAVGGDNVRPKAQLVARSRLEPTILSMKVFDKFHADPDGSFKGTTVQRLGRQPEELVRSQLRTVLLYHPTYSFGSNFAVTPASQSTLLMPEELPVVLALFHLSSIVRYKPEFFARVRDSRHWPIVVAARQHSLYKFLLLFWCFMQQQTVSFTRV